MLALPQGIAFATLAGHAAAIRHLHRHRASCIVAALFGSEPACGVRPDQRQLLALFAALAPLAIPGSPDYIAYALAVTGLVGVMQLALGAFKLGWVTDFIAPAVLIGFMGGAAILIGLYAVPDFLGLAAAGPGRGARRAVRARRAASATSIRAPRSSVPARLP